MTDPRPRRPRLTYDAPVLAFDYPADGDPVWPCTECLPWHLEVVVEDGEVLIREWHAAECPVFTDDEGENSE
ncbi:hypothetical protein [Kineococcus rhizosphaerae]|uniref:Uncharacterized protein n=1 Tax=Kineococcus rhizosphaerae TaxID=559628 RepID=A0A2T0R248_9ACTN|nr:hypothetical protein [Kineococcus rhizosphaerae]PRY13594.1 hypothetical protein CLV37_108264 [Kineococcus rhizosphaerae]